jgi:hypothetical protein
MFLRVIACEIAFRELCFAAARTPNLIDFDFLTQGYHDTPSKGREEVQRRIDAVPEGKYDAIVLGYGLCSNILAGVAARHTRLIIPRAHDCITFFLGSKERYRKCFDENPGTYYYTSGWLECAKRRGIQGLVAMPLNPSGVLKDSYEKWVAKYGEDQAKYLMEEMGRWTESYSNGTFIGFDFNKELPLRKQVETICADRGWKFHDLEGSLSLLERLLGGSWDEAAFLEIKPGQKIAASFDEKIIKAE